MTLQNKFESIGGQFFTPENIFRKKAENIKAYIFDWDGVFNNGGKSGELGSPFSEPDSMGTNMLRFSFLLKNKSLPLVFIATGAKNISAINFAKREHFHGIFLKYKNKATAVKSIEKEHGISPENMAFFFDDILDLGAAKICGLSFCIKRKANPLFNEYVSENNLCDYMSAHSGGNHGLRECCELLIGLNGNYGETISKRAKYIGAYQEYLSARDGVELRVERGD